MDAAKKTNVFLFIYFIAIITPLYEGLVFTYPYQKIKNKKLAYIFISVVFALLHLTASNSLIELLYFIPYLSLGLALNYSFYKTNNVFMSIIVHAINDLLVYVLLLII
jgi:membrane protease YdiL (CAAX protease family)